MSWSFETEWCIGPESVWDAKTLLLTQEYTLIAEALFNRLLHVKDCFAAELQVRKVIQPYPPSDESPHFNI